MVICSGSCGNWISEEGAAEKWKAVYFPTRNCVRYFCPFCRRLDDFQGDVRPISVHHFFIEIGLVQNMNEVGPLLKKEKVCIDGTRFTKIYQKIWLLPEHIIFIGKRKLIVKRVDNRWQIEDWTQHDYTIDLPLIS